MTGPVWLVAVTWREGEEARIIAVQGSCARTLEDAIRYVETVFWDTSGEEPIRPYRVEPAKKEPADPKTLPPKPTSLSMIPSVGA